jgi:hypothetical protein
MAIIWTGLNMKRSVCKIELNALFGLSCMWRDVVTYGRGCRFSQLLEKAGLQHHFNCPDQHLRVTVDLLINEPHSSLRMRTPFHRFVQTGSEYWVALSLNPRNNYARRIAFSTDFHGVYSGFGNPQNLISPLFRLMDVFPRPFESERFISFG